MSVAWVAVGTAAVGAYASYSAADKQAEAMKEAGKADPRMSLLLYGDGTKENPGLLNQARSLYEQNPTGLNDRTRQGMNDQWGVLTDPALRQGYNNMSNLGSQLMNQPIAGNPFTDGRSSLDKPFDGMATARRTQMAPGLMNSQGFYNQPGLQNNRPDYFAQPHEANRYGNQQQGLIGMGQNQGSSQGQNNGMGGSGGIEGAVGAYDSREGLLAPQNTSTKPGLPGWVDAPFGGPASNASPSQAPGPFTATPAPVADKPVVEEPAHKPAGPYTNRPFDPAAFQADFWTRYSNGTATPADIAEYNTISNRNAG